MREYDLLVADGTDVLAAIIIIVALFLYFLQYIVHQWNGMHSSTQPARKIRGHAKCPRKDSSCRVIQHDNVGR